MQSQIEVGRILRVPKCTLLKPVAYLPMDGLGWIMNGSHCYRIPSPDGTILNEDIPKINATELCVAIILNPPAEFGIIIRQALAKRRMTVGD